MRTALLALLLLAGCSKQNSQQPVSTLASVLVLASNERGRPQFDYSGPDSLSYQHSLDTFTFQIGPAAGTPWATAKGEMKLGSSNDVTITIQSTSDRAYDIQLLGLSTTNNFDVTEDKIKEMLHVPAGDKKLTIERFVIYTYDFAKR
jgi:hypothetical protein